MKTRIMIATNTTRLCLGCVIALMTGMSSRVVSQVHLLGPGHMDIDFNVTAAGEWVTSLHHDVQGEFPVDTNSILYASSELMPAGNRIARPSGSQWNFLGVNSGEPIWVFPQVQGSAPNAVWPGLSTEGTSSSILGTWDPETPLVGSGKWMELSLVGMTYYGTETVHEFSLWTTGTFGTPNVWMSTRDGISGLDAFPMLPGGHSHMNWGFTGEGVYDLTFQFRTVLANGTLSESDPVTVRFGINATAVPEPGRMTLMLAGMVLVVARRRRRRAVQVNTSLW